MKKKSSTITAPQGTLPRLRTLAVEVDRRIAASLRPATLPALRVLLGVLFVWFGALKVVGASPVAGIVSGTLPWADPHVTVVALGSAEVVFGAALIMRFALRLVLPLLAGHLAGTFLTFVMLPELMFHGQNPLLLTETGEFVTKNLVLIAATMVLISHTGGVAMTSAQAATAWSRWTQRRVATPDASSGEPQPVAQPSA
jgi:putative oxidoreductase